MKEVVEDFDLFNFDKEDQTNLNEYILGTLIIRLMGVRNLNLRNYFGENNKNLGSFLVNSLNKQKKESSGMVMAWLTFKSYEGSHVQIQRSSGVPASSEFSWSRGGEALYMDVTLPIDQLALEEEEQEEESSNNNEESQKNSQDQTSGIKHDNDQQLPLIMDGRMEKKTKYSTSKLPLHEKSSFNLSFRNEKHVKTVPILTINLQHTDSNTVQKGIDKLGYAINQEEDNSTNLGEAIVNLLPLVTGQVDRLDAWLTLDIPNNELQQNKADSLYSNIEGPEVRICVEYEPTDPSPRAGDLVRFIGYCNGENIFPVIPDGLFLVDQVMNDQIILSYKTAEGWMCTFQVHKNMVVCAERHQAAIEAYQDQIFAITQKLVHSPMYQVLNETVTNKLPNDGIVDVGKEAVVQGFQLVGRWLNGGIGTVVGDVIYATNFDGRHNNSENDDEAESTGICNEVPGHDDLELKEDNQSAENEAVLDPIEKVLQLDAIPGMPSCPITGEAMRDPVVAADGHTYERVAILKWFVESDKSPLTGNTVQHKELVPNFSLISTFSSNVSTSQSKISQEKLADGINEKEVECNKEDGSNCCSLSDIDDNASMNSNNGCCNEVYEIFDQTDTVQYSLKSYKNNTVGDNNCLSDHVVEVEETLGSLPSSSTWNNDNVIAYSGDDAPQVKAKEGVQNDSTENVIFYQEY